MTTIINDVKLDFQDVLLLPKRSEVKSREAVNLFRQIKFKYSSYGFFGVPIISANMATVGTIQVAEIFKKYGMAVALHKFVEYPYWYVLHHESNPYTFVSTGTSEEFLNLEWKPKFICIDIANGYSKDFSSYVSRVRDKFPESCIMAGNVVTGDMVYDLIEKGADIVKVGIGSGSVCTTRKITGVGYPQLSAIMECSEAAHGVGGLICGDGGIVVPGDCGKGFAAGADFIMAGGIFAGTDETGDKFYGMSSEHAMNVHYGQRADYRASEGKVVSLPSRGPLKAVVEEILGGLRSTCSYVGARNLKDLPKCATFIRVNHQLNTSLDKYEQ